jgi:hypothetical protein
VPFGINLAIAVVPTVVAVIASAAIPLAHPAWRLVPPCAVLLVAAAGTVDIVAGAVAGLVGFLLVDGFLVNRLGELSWHGMSDVDRATAIALCVGCGWVVGAVRRVLRQRRSWRLLHDFGPPALPRLGRTRPEKSMEVEHG